MLKFPEDAMVFIQSPSITVYGLYKGWFRWKHTEYAIVVGMKEETIYITEHRYVTLAKKPQHLVGKGYPTT